jgi:N-acetylneuraminic acid mutarotase
MSPTRRSVVASLGALTAGCAALAPAARGRWTARAALPYAVQELYAARWNGRVAIAGGMGPDPQDRALDRTAFYDPERDRWIEGPRLPVKTHHPVVGVVGGRLYAVGGFVRANGGWWSATSAVWRLDEDRWVEATAAPGPQSEAVGVTLGERLHLVSGRAPKGAANAQWNDQGDVALHRVFDGERWAEARPVPMARNSGAGVDFGGALHLVGGRTVAAGATVRHDRYDPEADRWEELAPLPQGAGGIAAGVLGGRIVVFGGEWFPVDGPGGGVYAATWIYDPERDRWEAGAPMRTPRHGLAGVTVGERLYAIGGAKKVGAQETSDVLEAFSL